MQGMVAVEEVARKFARNKDAVLRKAKALELKIHYGPRRKAYLSQTDETCLANHFRKASGGVPISRVRLPNGWGWFYIIQLEPEDRPTKLKLGWANDPSRRVTEHRTTAPKAQIVKSWPCKKAWEATAIDSLTRDACKKLGREVFEANLREILDRADAFFSIMPAQGPASTLD